MAFIIERLSKYPPAVRASIPTILALSINTNSASAFHILLYAVCQSQGELDKIRELDSTLLDLNGFDWCNDIFCHLFEDRSLAGLYYVHSGSYLALAKQIVSTIFAE